MKCLIYLIFSCICISCCKKLPSYINVCSKNNPNIGKCLLENVEILRPKLLHGVPELLIPSFNPLLIPEASLQTGGNFRASFKNISIYHAEEFKVESLHFDVEKVHLELGVHFPRLRIKSTYNVNGNILILQLNGNGPADGNLTDLHANVAVSGTPYMQNGQKHVKFEQEEKFDLIVGKPHFLFENIFGDNNELNEQTNRVLNENIEDLIIELEPVLKQVISQFIFGVTNNIFRKFSYDELFPDI